MKQLVIILFIFTPFVVCAQMPTFTLQDFYTGCFGEGVSDWDSVVSNAVRQKKLRITKRQTLDTKGGILLDFRCGAVSWNITRSLIFSASVTCTYKTAKECDKAFQAALQSIQTTWKFVEVSTDSVPPPPPSSMTLEELRASRMEMRAITFHNFTAQDGCNKKQTLSIYKESERSFIIAVISR